MVLAGSGGAARAGVAGVRAAARMVGAVKATSSWAARLQFTGQHARQSVDGLGQLAALVQGLAQVLGQAGMSAVVGDFQRDRVRDRLGEFRTADLAACGRARGVQDHVQGGGRGARLDVQDQALQRAGRMYGVIRYHAGDVGL